MKRKICGKQEARLNAVGSDIWHTMKKVPPPQKKEKKNSAGLFFIYILGLPKKSC